MVRRRVQVRQGLQLMRQPILRKAEPEYAALRGRRGKKDTKNRMKKVPALLFSDVISRFMQPVAAT